MKLEVKRRNKKTWVFEYDPLTFVFIYRARKNYYWFDFRCGQVKSFGGKPEWKVRDIVRPEKFELVRE